MEIINPATEEVRVIEETPIEAISGIIEAAKDGQSLWGSSSLDQRISVLNGLVPLIAEKKKLLAQTITGDMGRPLGKSSTEVERTVKAIEFFLKEAPQCLADEEVAEGFTMYEPLGVIAVISPWNVPLFVPLIAIVPALLAGNAVVFKPSEHSIFTGIEIGRLFEELKGFPKNALRTVVGGKKHGKEIVAKDIEMVCFTGSTRAGKEIMKKSAEKIHKVLLELGGLDAAIVLKDVDISRTAEQIVRINANNSGQICCSIKRVYVAREIHDDFVEAAVEASKNISLGPPEEEVDMGPLVAKFQLEKVEETVEDAKQSGAQVLSGGKRLGDRGYYYPSTIITDVNHEMKIMREEAFGPLLPIFPVDSWEEAVRYANDTRYGLTGSVWTKNKELGKKIAAALEVGIAGINAHGTGPMGTPFGGAKESGIGRMKTKDGVRQFSNIKFVRVEEND